jgi:hypothetical protein
MSARLWEPFQHKPSAHAGHGPDFAQMLRPHGRPPAASRRRRRGWLWPALVCLSLLFTSRAAAQPGIEVTANPGPEFTFGKVLTFRLSVASEAPIQSITLLYRVMEADSQVSSASAAFTPGQAVTAIYTRDLTAYALAPFTHLEYWWEIRDEAQHQLTTTRQTFFYEDNRLGWQTASQAPLTLHWYQGDSAFGQDALGIATAGLALANRDLQAPLPDHIDIYVYANAADAQEALKPAGRIWIEARADPVLNLIVAIAAPGVDANLNLGRQLPHELTHLLIYRLTGDHYAQVPGWLNEGLAVAQQARPDPQFAAVLDAARAANQLLPLASLCQPFPADPAQAQLAYAQSESIVRYLQRHYPPATLSKLLSAYAGGANCEDGVERGLGLSLAELQKAWQSDLAGADATANTANSSPWPWVALSGVVLLAGGVLALLVLSGPKARRS